MIQETIRSSINHQIYQILSNIHCRKFPFVNPLSRRIKPDNPLGFATKSVSFGVLLCVRERIANANKVINFKLT